MHDESEWIRQVAQGDERAFERLFRCHAPRIFRFAMSYLNDPAHAHAPEIEAFGWELKRRKG
jgi:DNA-directed RNA polymerase specialized sigma24 family protein